MVCTILPKATILSEFEDPIEYSSGVESEEEDEDPACQNHRIVVVSFLSKILLDFLIILFLNRKISIEDPS